MEGKERGREGKERKKVREGKERKEVREIEP